MNLKAASFLAFVGMLILSVVVIADLVRDMSGFLREILPFVRLIRELVYAFASVTVTVFLYVFYKRQS
jgi:predicted neutral ceramidase superfamily lipid hydrolase